MIDEKYIWRTFKRIKGRKRAWASETCGSNRGEQGHRQLLGKRIERAEIVEFGGVGGVFWGVVGLFGRIDRRIKPYRGNITG